MLWVVRYRQKWTLIRLRSARSQPGWKRRGSRQHQRGREERELISERTRAALVAAKARGALLGGDRGYRPSVAPCAARAAVARGETADNVAHRLLFEIERLQAEGVATLVGLARALTRRGVPSPRGGTVWTHTTVARLVARVGHQ